ncbi:unnamed protein product [Linum tenue]|uniref:Uncharacterized protein n=1 Tax=Linum tenue TaxID=586396 RepID=A0AAV0GW22_9ROSI|nr:unnamed protein product [Linum tenue]
MVCFVIGIGNEWRSGGMCGTTYWITPVWHEALDVPLAMVVLVHLGTVEVS